MKPSWLIEADKYTGLTEIPGVNTEPKIAGFWKRIGLGGIKDDETPWCAAFVGAMLAACGIAIPRHNPGLAKSYLDWGTPLAYLVPGCIVVLSRTGGGGHVFIADSIDDRGRIGGIGGNQGNKVSHAFFDRNRVLGYRWPIGIPCPDERLQLVANAESSSQNEA